MHSNRYIIVYSTIMVLLTAISLTFVAVQLKTRQEDNIRIEKMQNILASANINTTVKSAIESYQKYVTRTLVVNNKGLKIEGVDAFGTDLAIELKKPADQQQLPVFIATLDNGDSCFIFPLRGKGLWGPIWGYISLTNDFNTIYGVTFDHKGETPGLGAEINTDAFEKPWGGKQLFEKNGSFTSITVTKGGAKPGDVHAVDAISGGTITSKALEKMVKDCMFSYEEFIKNKGKV